jgi:hypothetical protein
MRALLLSIKGLRQLDNPPSMLLLKHGPSVGSWLLYLRLGFLLRQERHWSHH